MKKKADSSSGLHTIENEKRPRVIKKRSGETAFKAKYHRRLTRVLAAFSCFAILGVGIVAIGSIFNKADPNVVDPGFVTVSYNPPTDGTLPVDHSALENIGYMNKRFSEQTKWYSEMHGTTVANTMGLNVAQSVNTYKQYDNQTLIMADITTSSMVNKARQFCYRGDEVLWRMGSGSSTSWATGAMGDDCYEKLLSMQWKEGEPYGHMSLATFTEKNGLPGTGFSVYVINEETLLGADAVIDHGDGTYSQTYYLDPAVDKAPCHYVNQMVFTGDLPSLPSFNYITVTYTFDSSWRILRSLIDEQYTAVMGVSATCSSAYQTDFQYDTQRAESETFNDYFKDYIGAPYTEPDTKAEITSLNCLTSAFASVLTEPVTFDLSLNVNGSELNGKVYVDVGSLTIETMDIRAQIGSLKVWLSEGAAYVEYGGIKAKLTVSELIDFIGGLTGQTEGGLSLDTDALLGSLADGEFYYDESSATLSSTLSLGIDLPVVFHFHLDGEGNVSLGNVIANLSFEKVTVGAAIQFGEGGLPALNAEEKARFTDLLPLVRDVATILQSKGLSAQLDYEGEGYRIEGTFSFVVKDFAKLDLVAQGSLNVTVGAIQKNVGLIYANDTLYLECDGMKIKVDVNEGIALIQKYLLPNEQATEGMAQAFDLGMALQTVFSDEFAKLLALENTESGANVLVQGTEILKAFGVQFALGEVKLSLGDGSIGVNALGVHVTLTGGSDIEPDTNGYVDITPVVSAIPAVFEKKSLGFAGTVTLTMGETALTVEIKRGTIGFANGLSVYAELDVTVGGTQIDIVLNVTKEDIAFVVDGIAARVRFDEFNDLTSALSDLYKRISSAVNGIIVTGEEDGILADDIETLMKKLGVADMLSSAAGSFDLSLLNDLVIGATESENGICTLCLGGLKAEIIIGTQDDYLAATLSFANEKFAVQGGLSLSASAAATMPERNYLGMTDFLELLDYANAAVNTLTAENLSVSFAHGTIATCETENGVETVKTYDVSGKVDYYSGGSYPFVIDTQQQKVVVNVDLYAHVEFNYLDKANGNNLFLTLDLLDYDENGVLDFFVTLSRFENGDAKYQPLKLYATADELMNILATGCAMLGVNYNLVNNYLVNKWLSVDTQAQLRALGSSLLRSIGVDDIFASLGGKAATAKDGEEKETQGSFIRNLIIGKTQFTLQLADCTVEIGKTTVTENEMARSYLTGIGYLTNDSCVEITIDALGAVSVPAITLSEDYFKLEGIARLLQIMTTSATHRVNGEAISGEEQPAGYALNSFFYIDGTITANLNVMGILSKEVKIKLVAISVTVSEDGEVSANMRLEYDGVNVVGQTAINGDTVVDLTLKNGMIYMKRVQSTYFDGSTEKTYPNPVTVYRVMPLANFGSDVVNQAAFLLNLGNIITKNLPTGDEGTSEPPQEEVLDYGALFSKYIGSCVYTPNANDTCDYVLTIKGSALADILNDIVISMRTCIMDDGSEVLYDLGVVTGIKYSVLDIGINAALIFENPCNIPVEDKTVNVASDVSKAMEKALDEANRTEWAGVTFIEGQTTTVSYVLAGETIATQEVLFNSKTSECYANLVAPDTKNYVREGYDIAWDFTGVEADGKYFVSANQMIYGSYQARVYHLTLVGENGWTAEFDYVYGTDLLAAINNAYATESISAVSCSLSVEAILNGETEGCVVWKSHDYAVYYYGFDGAVFATQYYKAGSPLAYPQTNPARVGYVLDGWQNAAGERVENGSTVTDNAELYPVWTLDTSKEITVRLYSDVRYQHSGNSVFDPEKDGYYTEVTYAEQSGYSLPTLTVEGYQQMGWWYYGEDGSWSRVTDVTGLNGANLWAVWIQNISVTVTNFAKKASTYTIEGLVEGGNVYGKKSAEIYNAVGMTEDTAGVFTIIRKNGKDRDKLKYGGTISIQYGEDGIGTFSESGMTSFNALFWTVGYGGIKITKTFSYGNGLSVSTESASYVSIDTYTVNFVDENGNLIKSVDGVRLDCPYDDYDSNVYIDKLAVREGIVAPAKEGYVASWEHVAVTGNITVRPHYEKI